MQIVIDIPEDVYKRTVFYREFRDLSDCVAAIKALEKATPLPKGHGTLKDVDNIKTAFPSGEYVRTESVRATIDHEDTIIEADKAESEVRNEHDYRVG